MAIEFEVSEILPAAPDQVVIDIISFNIEGRANKLACYQSLPHVRMPLFSDGS